MDSPGRTERARRLLYPVPVAAVLVVVGVAALVLASATPPWAVGAAGLAAVGAGVAGQRRRR